MKLSAAVFALLLIILPLAVSVTHSQAQSTSPVIVVLVKDQNGAFYDGANVQVWQQAGPFVDSGSIMNGTWSSPSVAEFASYVVFVSNGVSTENQTVAVDADNVFVSFVLYRPSSPVISLSNVAFQPETVSPGTNFQALLTLSSSTNTTAYDGVITLNSTSSPPGITISGGGTSVPFSSISGDSSKTFNVTFSANPTAATGSYGIGYRISYRDATGSQYGSSGSFSVPVSGTPSRPDLIASQVSFSPSVVTPGTDFVATVEITNTGNQNALGSSISLTPNSEISIVGGTGVISIGTINAGENVSVNFEMFTNPSTPTGAVPVKFAFSYTNPLGVLFNNTGVFTVGLTATPDLKIGAFSIQNAPLTPGLSTFLSLSLINVGGDTAFDVALTMSGSQFLTINSTNYLGAIENGTSAKASLLLAVSNATRPGSFNLNIGIAYKDLAGRNYSENNNYSVQVQPLSPPAISVTNILLDPPVLSSGTSGSVTLFFKNSGSSDAGNVIVRVLGGNGIISTNYFGLGTISASGQVTQVIGLNVGSNLSPGNYTVLFNTTYSDQTGKTYSSISPMEVTIYGSTSFLTTRDIIAIVGVVVVGLVCLFFLRRYKVI